MSKQRHNSSLSSGFTLVELLVVIAIIGVLAAVILTSLINGRKVGNDSTIKNQLGQLFAISQSYFSDNGGNYQTGNQTTPGNCDAASNATTMFGDPRAAVYLKNITDAQGGTLAGYCVTSETAFAIIVKSASVPNLKGTNAGVAFCIDSTGTVKSENIAKTQDLSDGLTGKACK